MNASNNQVEVEAAEEVVATETVDHNVAVAGEHIYLQTSSSFWSQAACDVYMHAWGGTGIGTTFPGIKLGSLSAGQTLLVYTLTESDAALIDGFTHLMLLRMSPGTQTEWNRWDYYDANTLSDAAGVNYFTNTAWDSFNVGWDEEKTVYLNGPSEYSGWGTSTYVHAWDEGVLGTIFPGFPIDSVNTTGATNFNNRGAIYRVRVPSTTPSVIFNNGTSSSSGGIETGTLTVVDGANYTVDSLSLTPTGDLLMGAAAKFVYETDKAIRAVSESEGISSGSVCGLSYDVASGLYAQYQALDAGVKDEVDASTLYTYDPSDPSQQANVTYGDIAAQLALLAGGNGESALANLDNGADHSFLGVAAVIGISLIATASYLYLKKRKEAR